MDKDEKEEGRARSETKDETTPKKPKKKKGHKDETNDQVEEIELSMQPSTQDVSFSSNTITSSAKDKKPRELGIKVAIMSLRSISVVDQDFTVDLYLETTVKDDSFRGKLAQECDTAKIVPFYFLKKKKSREESWNMKPSKDGDIVYYKMRFEGTFAQKFNLKSFPFDLQSLKILVSCNKSVTDLVLKKSEHRVDTIKSDESTFILQDYRLWEHVVTSSSATPPERSSTSTSYPLFEVSMHVSRAWGYYFWNVYLVLFLLVSMAGSTFAFSSDNLGDRMNVVITMVLTVVAFKFSISQTIPRINYATYLDRYFLACMTFLSAAVLENALFIRIQWVADNDSWIGIIFLGLWILYHAWFVLRAISIIQHNNYKMLMLNRDFKDYIQNFKPHQE